MEKNVKQTEQNQKNDVQTQQNNKNEFDRKAFLESFRQYRLTEDAEIDFRGFAKQGKDADKDIIEKRISVLIHTARSVKELPHNKCRYQFAGFVILTNEEDQTIEVVYWIKRKLKVSKAMDMELKQKYNAVGLDETGFDYLANQE